MSIVVVNKKKVTIERKEDPETGAIMESHKVDGKLFKIYVISKGVEK